MIGATIVAVASPARVNAPVGALPTHDWQFWIVSALALVAAIWLLRGVVPVWGFVAGAVGRALGRSPRLKGERRATLTIGGKRPGA